MYALRALFLEWFLDKYDKWLFSAEIYIFYSERMAHGTASIRSALAPNPHTKAPYDEWVRFVRADRLGLGYAVYVCCVLVYEPRAHAKAEWTKKKEEEKNRNNLFRGFCSEYPILDRARSLILCVSVSFRSEPAGCWISPFLVPSLSLQSHFGIFSSFSKRFSSSTSKAFTKDFVNILFKKRQFKEDKLSKSVSGWETESESEAESVVASKKKITSL